MIDQSYRSADANSIIDRFLLSDVILLNMGNCFGADPGPDDNVDVVSLNICVKLVLKYLVTFKCVSNQISHNLDFSSKELTKKIMHVY